MSHNTRFKFTLDSGATQHMASNGDNFNELFEIDEINIGVSKKNQKLTMGRYGNILVQTAQGAMIQQQQSKTFC